MFRHAPPDYECPFCAVARGGENAPWTFRSDVVHHDDTTTGWINRRWWVNNPGAVVVVPNHHVENMYELDAELAGAVHSAARLIALAMKDAYGCDGIFDPAAQRARWRPGSVALPRARVPAVAR